MRILFTGASSFTGYWFVRALRDAGHEVVATLRRPVEEYTEPVRAARVQRLRESGACVPCVSFGHDGFLDLIERHGPWDALCHHAADVTNYKSPDFDVVAALANNTRNIAHVLAALHAAGCRRVVLTGSVFEPGAGIGPDGLPAFSTYGLSKGLTAEVFRYHCAAAGLRLGKFVIANPFGPFEEPRFTTYLVRHWLGGKTPSVNTPAYVRDNIHVTLLAKAYAAFVQNLPAEPGFQQFGPSQYVETQGAFAQRFAAEMRPRLQVPCPLDLRPQTEFSEPRIRLNTDALDPAALDWSESAAWDELALWYRECVRP